MVDKLHEYQGFSGRMHNVRDLMKEKFDQWKQEHPEGVKGIAMNVIKTDPHSRGPPKLERTLDDYPHIYRRKTRTELVKVSAAVMGIEFSYAAETAFVSPTLLKIGLSHERMTLAWGLSPLIGFFLTPVLGSLSDGCRFSMGRRRPFILLLALGVLLGLILVPNGEDLGYLLGDHTDLEREAIDYPPGDLNLPLRKRSAENYPGDASKKNDSSEPFSNAVMKDSPEKLLNLTETLAELLLKNAIGSNETGSNFLKPFSQMNNDSNMADSSNTTDFYITDTTAEANVVTDVSPTTANGSTIPSSNRTKYVHPWGVFFTVLGTVLLDFDADSCQSPARAYLLDVTLPEDHARGLSTFTIMAGLGGFFGYALGGINWDATAIGAALGGHVRAVFTLITVLFCICVAVTVTSFKEIPLDLLEKEKEEHNLKIKQAIGNVETIKIAAENEQSYGTLNDDSSLKNQQKKEIVHPDQIIPRVNGNSSFDFSSPTSQDALPVGHGTQDHPTLKEYLLSIIFMPHSLRMVCLTNLFCWMAHVCYSLYFTDFVGEAVFDGNPDARDSKDPNEYHKYELYEEGVRFGCWGMSMYSLSCSCYSLVIESLIKRFKARNVYVGGLLFYSLGMALMALTKDRIGVILFSWTAGVMYSTLFTMPYLLVAHYHANGVFGLTKDGEVKLETRHRGLGTDVAIVSSMVFLAQFLLSICMGSIVSWSGTTTAVVTVASILAFCGAISATRIMYLDL